MRTEPLGVVARVETFGASGLWRRHYCRDAIKGALLCIFCRSTKEVMRVAYICFGGVFCLFVVGVFLRGGWTGGWVGVYVSNKSKYQSQKRPEGKVGNKGTRK